jgi:hypothetical protein
VKPVGSSQPTAPQAGWFHPPPRSAGRGHALHDHHGIGHGRPVWCREQPAGAGHRGQPSTTPPGQLTVMVMTRSAVSSFTVLFIPGSGSVGRILARVDYTVPVAMASARDQAGHSPR